jgi:hypothetical protein
MIVWDGNPARGARYDPATDAWEPVSTTGAPTDRGGHTAVWAGTEMIIWGGSGGGALDTGGRYNPATDTWLTTATVGAASPRSAHTAIWTGSEMIVWGGYEDSSSYLDTGGAYDPALDTWRPVAAAGAPSARREHTAVWTGEEMIVWGGWDDTATLGGGRYAPGSDTWSPVASPVFLQRQYGHSAVWTGSRMIAWGGFNGEDLIDRGGRYDPVTDTWTPTFTPGNPSPRYYHTSIWTGNLMLIWGGTSLEAGGDTRTGGRYDPLTDDWTEMNWVDAPAARALHTAVWTGTRMIVWGVYQSGGLYDPLTDQWTPTSIADAPSSRTGHTAVWTGTEMIVWGGERGGLRTNTGARYDPQADIWTPTSLVNAPSKRQLHTAVWTGEVMIVWGGRVPDYPLPSSNAGGRYDPVTDWWLPNSPLNDPPERYDHTAVWTGDEMLVWGGRRSPYDDVLGTGVRYDPRTDRWTDISVDDAPSAREFHTAVWTGSEMLVWGGSDRYWGTISNTGGRYDPATDTWEASSLLDAPEARDHHTAVWADPVMIVWGGLGGLDDEQHLLSTGGRYSSGTTSDLDGDGFTVCDLDCDDLDEEIYPGAPEICDGADSDCDGVLPPDEEDVDQDGVDLCSGDCDDEDPFRFPGNVEVCDSVDNDCDGISSGHPTVCGVGECVSTGTCVDGSDSCVPLPPVPEVCDGLDNDCNGMLPLEELDRDADGWTECTGDCDEAYWHTYPGAPEINDDHDNQCNNLVDEVVGPLIFPDAADPALLSWVGQEYATGYEVSRSELPDLAADCVRFRVSGTSWLDPEGPPVGGIFHYLVQSTEPFVGSLGQDGLGAERILVCGGENDCDNWLDDDGDGLLDCNDPGCFGKSSCDEASISFTDTFSDDVDTHWLEEFFLQTFLQPGDYLYLRLEGGGLETFELCLQRADFYRDEYLRLAPTSGISSSGGWEKWRRIADGDWVGPTTDSFENWYGENCAEPYSWCAEVFLGGHMLGIAPWETGICENFDYIDCGDGSTTLSLKVGLERALACGF